MTVMEARQFYLASKALVVYQLYVVGNPGVEPGISPTSRGMVCFLYGSWYHIVSTTLHPYFKSKYLLVFSQDFSRISIIERFRSIRSR